MRPVDQTIGGSDGDCLAAALASIVEAPLSAFAAVQAAPDGDWWAPMCDTLRPFGLTALYATHDPPLAPKGYHVALGQPREYWHATVALDGRIIHDPHPSRVALTMPVLGWVILVPLAQAEQ